MSFPGHPARQTHSRQRNREFATDRSCDSFRASRRGVLLVGGRPVRGLGRDDCPFETANRRTWKRRWELTDFFFQSRPIQESQVRSVRSAELIPLPQPRELPGGMNSALLLESALFFRQGD